MLTAQWQRRVSWLATLSVIVVALVYGFRPQPRPVEIALATRAPMQVFIEEEGRTRVVDRYIVSAPVAGTTCRIELDVGDHVTKDQPLVTIRPLQAAALDPRSRAMAEARVAVAQSALNAAKQRAQSARAEATLAAKELARLEPLAAQGHISEDELDQAAFEARGTEAARRSSDFAVDVAQHELEAARAVLQFTGRQGEEDLVDILAPVAGRVLRVLQECEAVVSAGQPLLEIGDTSSLEVETDVLSADAVRIKPGMPVMYERWGGDEPLEGRVRRIEPVGFTKVSALGVEEQRVLVISNFTLDAAHGQPLGDGYRVESRFILWEGEDILQIPASALFRVKDGWAVFVVQGGKARQRAVKLGQRNGLAAQVLEGLVEGEGVVSHPDDALVDGVAVRQR